MDHLFSKEFCLAASIQSCSTIQYLDIGCGQNTHDNFINLDYVWHPKVDLCWDISGGIPLATGSLRGIFTEHCLEHLPLAATEAIIQECHRLLKPGGRINIIVPDAELYLTRYADRIRQITDELFPFEQRPPSEPILAVNCVFYQDRDDLAGHRFMYDFNFLRKLLSRHGFSEVTRSSYGTGADRIFLIDTKERAVESLYVEGCV